MALEIGGAGRSVAEATASGSGIERPAFRIGVREQPHADDEFAAQMRSSRQNEGARAPERADQAGNDDNASIYEDAVEHHGANAAGDGKQLTDAEAAQAGEHMDALTAARNGREINTGDAGLNRKVSDAIGSDPMIALHQGSLDRAIGKMEQAVASRDPEALEAAAKDAMQSAKDLDAVRNDHEKNALSRTSLGETTRQNGFTRGNMMVAGGIAVAGLASAATVGGIAANKNLQN